MSDGRRRLRIGLLGLYHEANSFAPIRVDQAYIEAAGVFRGPELLEEYRGSDSTAGGFIAAADADPGVELIPLVLSTLVPAGPITEAAFAAQCAMFQTCLEEEGPFDGVLAVLHGAAVAENVDDVDGYLLGLIRSVVGPDVIIGTSLDLHANISASMCASATVLNTYRTNPHVDARPMAEEVARIVFRAARGEVSPTVAFVPVPAFINILQQNTGTAPMAEIMSEVRGVSELEGVLTVSVAEGYPYADVPEMGMSVVVVTDGDAFRALELARGLARQVWTRRSAFEANAPTVEEAMELVATSTLAPVLLLDVGDNIGGGAPGDSVILLEAAIDHGLRSVAIIVVDRDSATMCHCAGLGGRVSLTLGTRAGASLRGPLLVRGEVVGLSSGRFEDSRTLHAGFRHFDAGPSAAVRLESGQTVVVISRVTLPLSPAQLSDLGLSVMDFHAVVAKGVHSPIAGYGPEVARIIHVDTPGVTSADCSRFTYRRRRRPLFPLERDVSL